MLSALVAIFSHGQEIRVNDLGSLRRAVVEARPGDRILVAAGNYAGGVYVTGIHGTGGAPIVICAADALHRPSFRGAFQFQASSYLEVCDLDIVGVSGNAIGIDDGGVRENPAHHILLSGLHISDIPGQGSNGIKMAGVDDFRIEKCVVERWGGCAVDMVGCHKGNLEKCKFSKGGGVAVQAKGASSDITIRRCAFAEFGGRGVNIGGSTGNSFYRPPLDKIEPGKRYEAKNITVEGCTFDGGDASIAFTGADGALVRFNTILNPAKWAIRILQETAADDFVQCRNGRFEDNIVVFKSFTWSEGGVNVGSNTAPTTFRFSRNWWYCTDKPVFSKPILPTLELDDVAGQNPMLNETDLTLKPDSPAREAGAQALPTANG